MLYSIYCRILFPLVMDDLESYTQLIHLRKEEFTAQIVVTRKHIHISAVLLFYTDCEKISIYCITYVHVNRP